MKLNMLDNPVGAFMKEEKVYCQLTPIEKQKNKKIKKISQISMDHFLKKDGSMQWTHKTNQLGWGKRYIVYIYITWPLLWF
jgi:hypothetical protein